MFATHPPPGAVEVALAAQVPAVPGSNFTLLSAYPGFPVVTAAVPSAGTKRKLIVSVCALIGVAKLPVVTG